MPPFIRTPAVAVDEVRTFGDFYVRNGIAGARAIIV